MYALAEVDEPAAHGEADGRQGPTHRLMPGVQVTGELLSLAGADALIVLDAGAGGELVRIDKHGLTPGRMTESDDRP